MSEILAAQSWSPEFDSQSPHKKLDAVVSTNDPSTLKTAREAETGQEPESSSTGNKKVNDPWSWEQPPEKLPSNIYIHALALRHACSIVHTLIYIFKVNIYGKKHVFPFPIYYHGWRNCPKEAHSLVFVLALVLRGENWLWFGL